MADGKGTRLGGALVTPPRAPTDDPKPALFAEHILVGAARHAFAVDALRAQNVTHVLNLAPPLSMAADSSGAELCTESQNGSTDGNPSLWSPG